MPDVLKAGLSAVIEPPMTEDELADLLQITPAVCRRMRKRGEGPSWVECAGFVRYPAQSVRKFLNVRRSRKKTPVDVLTAERG